MSSLFACTNEVGQVRCTEGSKCRGVIDKAQECADQTLSAGTSTSSGTASNIPGNEIQAANNSGKGFTEIANANASAACSASDYSKIDHCFNNTLPPKPSILRPVGTAFTDSQGDVNRFQLQNHQAKAGNTVVLPFNSHTQDGRLVHFFDNWHKFKIFRPENMGYDLSQLSADKAPLSVHPIEVHGVASFNPLKTNFNIETEVKGFLGGGAISSGHSMICDASSAEADNGAQLQRNPRPCRAKYGAWNLGKDSNGQDVVITDSSQEMIHGMCYNISILQFADKAGKGEIRSTALTVFVPNPYKTNTGDVLFSRSAAWVYPQNPEKVFDVQHAAREVELPAFAPYDVGRFLNWFDMGESTLDMKTFGRTEKVRMRKEQAMNAPTFDVPAQCYVQARGGGWKENPSAPVWCNFLFVQQVASQLSLDKDGDANPDDSAGDGATVFTNGLLPHREGFLFEPSMTGDGKMLILNTMRGMMYSINADYPACDARGFQHMYPISLMPVDARVRAKYPVAQTRITHEHPRGEPFKDSGGRYVPLGSRQSYAYMWIDLLGKNMVFAAQNQRRNPYKVVESDARLRVADGLPIQAAPDLTHDGTRESESSRTRLGANVGHQHVVLGAWTQGRMVVIDNGLNPSDFGGLAGFSTSGEHYVHRFRLSLYSDADLVHTPMGNSAINSFENRLNMFDALRPEMPFDVVWRIQNNTQRNAEIVFDEYMHKNAFAVVHMNAAVHVYDAFKENGTGMSYISQEDGFYPTGYPFDASNPTYTFNGRGANHRSDFCSNTGPTCMGERIILQNATSNGSINNVRLRGGARVEPVALGGVLGKGVYLDGVNDFFDLGYINDKKQEWYAGIWLDSRETDNNVYREIFHFAGGAWIGLKRNTGDRYDAVIYPKSGHNPQTISLGTKMQSGKYVHFGVKISQQASSARNRIQRKIQIYINGDPLPDFYLSNPFVADRNGEGDGLSPMSHGALNDWTWMTVGAPQLGSACLNGTCNQTRTFKGWVDEFRLYKLDAADVVQGSSFDEYICNMALGSMRNGSSGEYCEQMLLESYDRPMDLPAQRLRTHCASNVHHNLGADPSCLRNAKLGMPAFKPAEPRIDTSTNSFCVTCHQDINGTPIGLHLDALRVGSVPRFYDRRRQPMEGPAVLALPPVSCDQSWTLNNTWYANVPTSTSAFTDDPVYPLDFAVAKYGHAMPH